jgi:hypothetical protein
MLKFKSVLMIRPRSTIHTPKAQNRSDALELTTETPACRLRFLLAFTVGSPVLFSSNKSGENTITIQIQRKNIRRSAARARAIAAAEL